MMGKPLHHWLLVGTIAVTALGSSQLAQADDSAKVTCQISDNSRPGSGTLSLLTGTQVVASGACTPQGMRVPPGSYTAVLQLDGALDAPEQRKTLVVRAGEVRQVQADFATGVLQVTIHQAGKPAAGMTIVRKAGRQIGTLGNGVSAHLSAGDYELVARYRSQEKRLGVVRVGRGERKTLQVDFE